MSSLCGSVSLEECVSESVFLLCHREGRGWANGPTWSAQNDTILHTCVHAFTPFRRRIYCRTCAISSATLRRISLQGSSSFLYCKLHSLPPSAAVVLNCKQRKASCAKAPVKPTNSVGAPVGELEGGPSSQLALGKPTDRIKVRHTDVSASFLEI